MIRDLLDLSALGIYVHAASVSITLGFPVAIAVALWKYKKTGNERFLENAKVLTAILAINFALGGVTGTLVEFGLVQIWPGTIFAIETFAFTPLTLELIAFISEVAFLVLFIVTFGKWRVEKSLIVLSAYWAFALLSGALITSVNSWMQSPQGVGGAASAFYPFMPSYGESYIDVQKLVELKLVLFATGRSLSTIVQEPGFAENVGIVLSNPYAAFSGSYFTASIFHNLTAAVIVGLSFATLGYSFRYMRTKDKHYIELLKPMFLVLFALMLVQPTIFGHLMGTAVVENQPTKFALMEGANQTFTDPLIGLVAYGDPSHPIEGFDQLFQACSKTGNTSLLDLANELGLNLSSIVSPNTSIDRLNISISTICKGDLEQAMANMNAVHYSYYLKIAVGVVALLSSAVLALSYYNVKGLSWLARKFLVGNSYRAVFAWSFILFISASAAAILGWFVREVGRKPWTVYGLLYPQEVVTPIQLSQSPIFLAIASLVIIAVAVLGYGAMFLVATRPQLVKKIFREGEKR